MTTPAHLDYIARINVALVADYLYRIAFRDESARLSQSARASAISSRERRSVRGLVQAKQITR